MTNIRLRFAIKSLGRRAVLSSVAAAALLSPAAAPGVSLYTVGNSLTADMNPPGIGLLAAQAGKPLSPVGFHIRGNSTMLDILANPTDGAILPPGQPGFTTALPGGDWDHITVQLYNRGSTTLADDLQGVAQFRALAETNPANADARWYLTAPWPLTNEWGDWNAPVVDSPTQATKHSAPYARLLMSKLEQQYPGQFELIPTGAVISAVRDRIIAGTLPGYTSIDEFYRDPVHLNRLGGFAATTTAMSVITRTNPIGLAVPRGAGGWTVAEVSDSTALALQQIVWQVVSSEPLTGVITPGDYNRDLLINAADYSAWVAAYGTNNAAADGNGDGFVNAADYTVWRDAQGAGPATSSAVPEPAAACLVAIAAVCYARRKRAG